MKKIDTAKRRLARIGINVEYAGNFPWVYLVKVNGVSVDENRNANHGYCVAILPVLTTQKEIFFRKDFFEMVRKLK